MKKKKLKQRISNLESQLVTAKSIAQAREDILYRFLRELEECGVKTEINTPKPTVIEVSQTEDDVAKYRFGIDTTQPAFSFDFTEHDKTLFKKSGFIFDKTNINGKYEWNMPGCRKEDNEPEEIKQCRDFLKRENKYYIYISHFFATPMVYESLGFSCGYKEVPIVKIKYSNGIESEVLITELVKYDTLEKCEKRCEELNEEMKGYKETWSRDYWRLRNITRENAEND